MDPVSMTASVIALLQLTGTAISCLNDVKNAPKDRAEVAIEVSNLLGLLTSLRYRLEDSNVSDPWFIAVRALNVENGPLDQFKDALDLLVEKLNPTSRWRKAGETLTWTLSKKEIQSVLARISRLKQDVQMALDNDHFKLSQAIQRETRSIHEVVTSLESGEDERQRESILDWLSTEDYFAQHLYFRRMRLPETGQWLIDSAELQTWLAVPKNTVFCPGDPGTGKTMLASRIIDLMEDLQELNVAYVYCNYKRHQQQSADAIFSALLKQLVGNLSPLPTAVINLYKKYSPKKAMPSADEVSMTLSQVLDKDSPVFLILDALDECDTTNDVCNTVLSKLRVLQSTYDVRLLCTSRPLPDIQRQFAGDSIIQIRAADSDVELFLENEVPRLPIVRRHGQLLPLIKARILESIDGMFLLARLYLDALKTKRTRRAVELVLENFSKSSSSLKDAYDNAIERIDSQSADDRKLARLVLSWITIPDSLLSTNELQHALAVALGASVLDEADMIDADDMISVCAGLVAINTENDVIGFVHYTTQEYMKERIATWIPDAFLDMSLLCLNYMAPFQGRLVDSPWGLCKEFPFLGHAFEYWGNYARKVQDHELVREAVHAFAENFCLNVDFNEHEEFCYQFRLHEDLGYFYLNFAPIHLASYFGLDKLIHFLLLQNQEWQADMADMQGYTPLYLASRYGHKDVVSYLIDRPDVDINFQKPRKKKKILDDIGTTPLHVATDFGREEIVEILLRQANIKPDIQAGEDGTGFTALHWAAVRGFSRIVAILLCRKDVDINKQGEGSGALHMAAYFGQQTVVELLLQRPNLDVNLQDAWGDTALITAARGGREKIAKLLLAHPNIDINVVDRQCGTALHTCCVFDSEAIAKLLLEREDCNANAISEFGSSVLMHAVFWGKEWQVRHLLGRKDIDTEYRGQGTESEVSADLWKSRLKEFM